MKEKRHEIKYLLNYTEYISCIRKVEKLLKRDMNSNENGYIVNSLYFDNYYNKAVTEKIDGLEIRHKYRIRYYNNNLRNSKLERKSKIGLITTKENIKITDVEVKDILNKQYSFLIEKRSNLSNEFYIKLKHELFEPKVIIKYRRQAFVHPIGNLRVTFDRSIKRGYKEVDIFNDNIRYVNCIEDDNIVMEIKYNGYFPDYIRSILQTGNIMREAVSKYVIAREIY
ncbi:polyphosphate polymerase domain-containing protein [Clostridiaceae bacterium M8S5]|nr:polyphosphate polymerase domain-containing protein [Clostridiaceae bacterium M8S5]